MRITSPSLPNTEAPHYHPRNDNPRFSHSCNPIPSPSFIIRESNLSPNNSTLARETTTITHRTARITRAGKRHENQMLILPSPALHIASCHIYRATTGNASLSLIYHLSSQVYYSFLHINFFIQPMFTFGINTKHKTLPSLDLIHLPHRNAIHPSIHPAQAQLSASDR